jgi:hypothetical protein
MGKCAKIIKCLAKVPKYAKANTILSLPYLKVIFQGLMEHRMSNYGHRD